MVTMDCIENRREARCHTNTHGNSLIFTALKISASLNVGA